MNMALAPLSPAGFDTFLLEWSTLGDALEPIGGLPGSTVMACVCRATGEVILWDAGADLGEQTAEVLAPHRKAWSEAQPFSWEGPRERLRERAAAHARDLADRLAKFVGYAERFHAEYQVRHGGATLEHDTEGELPRHDTWRPQRLCVHDVMLGAMVCQYDRLGDAVEVFGFSTRDHTAYARASGTRGLLLSLLCDRAKHGGTNGIVFRGGPDRGDALERVPWEVRLLARMLGVELQEMSPIPAADCERLLVAMTPLHRRLRRGPASEVERACLAVHLGMWSLAEAESLLTYAPETLRPFGRHTAGPSEAVRHTATLAHALRARLLGLADAVVLEAVEAAGRHIVEAEPALGVRAYGRRYVTDGRLEIAGRPIVGGDEFFVFANPAPDRLQALPASTGTVFLAIPERALILASVVPGPPYLPLTVDPDTLEVEVGQRLDAARRLA